MVKITATGKIADTKVAIIVSEENDKVTLEANDIVKDMLKDYMEMIPTMAGTYTPEKGSILAYYAIFTLSDLFTKPPVVDIVGELPTIPYESGVIY